MFFYLHSYNLILIAWNVLRNKTFSISFQPLEEFF